MSQVKISGNASGTGVLTIAAPNTNTDRSITLPDKAGAIAVGAGTIVQVVQGTTSTSVAVSTTTYTDTTLSASITPSSSSNKILVMVNQTANAGRSARPIGAGIQLLRDSTIILKSAQDTTGPFDQYVNVSSSTATNIITRYTINFLDSPATTSSVTYKTQGRPYTTANSGAVTFNQNAATNNATSTILLMEVVA